MVLDAASLRLIRVFTFQEVFPGLQSIGKRVSCIAVDPAMKIVRQLVTVLKYRVTSLHLPVDRGFHKHAHCSMVHVRRSGGYLAYPFVPSPSRRGLRYCLGLSLW